MIDLFQSRHSGQASLIAFRLDSRKTIKEKAIISFVVYKPFPTHNACPTLHISLPLNVVKIPESGLRNAGLVLFLRLHRRCWFCLFIDFGGNAGLFLLSNHIFYYNPRILFLIGPFRRCLSLASPRGRRWRWCSLV